MLLLYDIRFYQDRNGNEPVKEYLQELAAKQSKDSRIKLTKIRSYVKALREHGTRLGEPYVKHLDGEIWELRPIRDRILFAAWNGSSFVLLHYFMKKTQKTPKKEIAKAKRNLQDMKERSKSDETM